MSIVRSDILRIPVSSTTVGRSIKGFRGVTRDFSTGTLYSESLAKI